MRPSLDTRRVSVIALPSRDQPSRVSSIDIPGRWRSTLRGRIRASPQVKIVGRQTRAAPPFNAQRARIPTERSGSSRPTSLSLALAQLPLYPSLSHSFFLSVSELYFLIAKFLSDGPCRPIADVSFHNSHRYYTVRSRGDGGIMRYMSNHIHGLFSCRR